MQPPIWTFSDTIDRIAAVESTTKDGAPAASKLADLRDELKLHPREVTAGPTHLDDAIYEGVVELRRHWQAGINALVVVTDGTDNGSDRSEGELNRALRVSDPDNRKPVYVLITAAWDVACPDLLATVSSIRLNCF